MMQACNVSWSVKDKPKDVAGRIITSADQLYSTARKITNLWDKRRAIMKSLEAELLLEGWRKESFDLLPVSKKQKSDVGGRPKKRLSSDVISMKSENRILDDIIDQLKDHAHEQGIDPFTLVEKLVER